MPYNDVEKKRVNARKCREQRYERLTREGRCVRCAGEKERGDKALCTRCKRRGREDYKGENWEKYKVEVFNLYGGLFCSVCRESRLECLTLDHVHQNDSAMRKRGDKKGPRFYKEVCSSPLRNDLRVLCFNCNISAFRNEGTPHLRTEYVQCPDS